MSATTYATKALHHWTKWLPKKVAQLRQEGELGQALQIAGRQTQERVLELMQQGYRQHEAEEVALHELVLLPPEPEARLQPWERAELNRLEKEHRNSMG